jgi:enoyl-CoA hydratase/carnithine racemase
MDDLFAALCATEDAEEGVEAFLEKRKPVWKDR